MSPGDKDAVSIIGAGPAGLAAAIVLCRHGFPVRVYEQFQDVGHRLNGDFQGLENWSSESDVTELLGDTGIGINFLCKPFYAGDIYAPGMKPARIKSGRPIFYLVKRGPMPGTLDAGLKEQALSLGAEIMFNHRIGTFEGKAIVGTGPKEANAVAVGTTFDTDMGDTAAAVFDDGIAPKGYAYLLVSGGCGTMVTVLYSQFGRGNECFEKTMRFFSDRMDLTVRNWKRFGCFGNFYLSETRSSKDKLYVGESAGFQDYLWGFGIRYAIVSGYLAAKSFIDGSDYDSLWKKALKPMQETSLVNRYIFEKAGHAGYRYLARKFARGEPCAFLRRHYNPSRLKNILLPLAKRKHESATGHMGANTRAAHA